MRLKKLFGFIALITCSFSVFAQETAEKVEFAPYGYLQLQGGAGYTVGEAKFKDLISPVAAFSFGYQFTPVLGARIGVSGWESKGGWVNPSVNYKYNYIAGNLDVMLNMSNVFCSFNPKRVLNVYLFAGGAWNYAFNNDDAEELASNLQSEHSYYMHYLWKDNKSFIVGRFGLQADFRLSNRVSLNIEGNANVLSDHYNSKKADNADWYFNLLAGVTFRFGKGYKAVAPVVIPEPVQPAPEPIKEEPKPIVVEEKPVEKKVEQITREVFFAINSSIVSQSELGKVEELAGFLKKNPEAKITITGYADIKTGNPQINMRLSKVRAEEIARMLTSKYGIETNRIITEYKGDTEQPFDDNIKNRVSICIAK